MGGAIYKQRSADGYTAHIIYVTTGSISSLIARIARLGLRDVVRLKARQMSNLGHLMELDKQIQDILSRIYTSRGRRERRPLPVRPHVSD